MEMNLLTKQKGKIEMEEKTNLTAPENNSGADASYVADETYLHLVEKYEQKVVQNPNCDDEYQEEDEDEEDEIYGYHCSACGNIQEYGDYCKRCNAIALEPLYF